LTAAAIIHNVAVSIDAKPSNSLIPGFDIKDAITQRADNPKLTLVIAKRV
jgi:hypothetical protein